MKEQKDRFLYASVSDCTELANFIFGTKQTVTQTSSGQQFAYMMGRCTTSSRHFDKINTVSSTHTKVLSKHDCICGNSFIKLFKAINNFCLAQYTFTIYSKTIKSTLKQFLLFFYKRIKLKTL
jgi:hypothetical protein